MDILRGHWFVASAGAISAIFLAGLCYAQQGRQQKSSGGLQIVEDIVSARCGVEPADPSSLAVIVEALDSQGQPRNPVAILGKYESPPKDGIQDVFVLAVPSRGGQPAANRFIVKHTWKRFREEAPWLKGVRVHCAAGALVLPVEDGK